MAKFKFCKKSREPLAKFAAFYGRLTAMILIYPACPALYPQVESTVVNDL